MVAASPPPLHLPVFAGQGTAAATAPQTRQRAILDASSRSGSILLSACHEAFHRELSSLPAPETLHVAVDIADFPKPESLLSLPEGRYLQNPVISGSTLFLLQTLRYLSFIEATGISSDSLTPFSDILEKNSEHGLGVLGFSSGILPACVVATSTSIFSYISRAVEAYRLALWVGIHSQLYRNDTLKSGSLNLDTKLPWSLVFIGMSRGEAEVAISSFSKKLETPSIYITAIIDDTCVTISGRPDVLSAFSVFVKTERDSVVHKTSVDTLYHSPVHVNATRERLLADVASRNIMFPNFCDIKVPIRSTFDGHAITKDEPSGSLLEFVVDMLLTQPVNWNLVVEDVIRSSPDTTPIRLLNVGPGAGLTRGIERVFPPGHLSVIDLANADYMTHQERKAKQEPIAIIGMAVNMPGAPNVSKLWEILEQGINTISEIPEHRFKVSDYNEGQNSKRTMKAHTGNFIDAADEFDNKFFKISPREARSMDPQQRILLHTAYEALEDSGYVPSATPTSNPETFGCYIGVATHDYIQNLRDNIDVYYSPGTLKAFLSGRISYAMQLSGPSIVVDTACSSSNVALYQGARALMNRDCDSALVGGVNIVSSPDMFLGLDRGHFLSPTGQCKAFDASADGYSRSEGCGVFVLKRLSDALAENDRILGVIRGIEVNQSGLAHSITHPHAPTQAALFRRVLENSNVDPSRVNVVEAHGTGTQAGDPNELESIRSVFSVQRSRENPLHITSVKANIGHLEAASGAAGLAKLLLMLQHKRIPRQISLKQLNPRIAPLDSDNTAIDTVDVPWSPSHAGLTRLALLNNFGAAGSNTALLLEEHAPSGVCDVKDQMSFVFGLSAKDDATLEMLRSKFLHYLESAEEPLSNIAYTSTARRQIYDHRLAISANTVEDLIGKLRRALAVETSSKDARFVFVFSGQGGQYLGMGSALYRTSGLFRKHIDDCHEILVSGGFPGVLAIITSDAQTSGLSTSDEFEAYQASIFSLQYALAKLWMSWGLSPAAVIGHSLGEYAALVIANVVSLKDALFIVANRVRLMVQSCALRTTGMMAVNLGPAAVHEALHASPEFSVLCIACFNSPIDCVVAGPLVCLKAFKSHLDAQVGCKNIILAVPFGYHSLAMAPLLDDLTAVARRASLSAPTIPIVSNVLGRVVSPGDSSVFDAAYFARHCAEPVQFNRGVQALVAYSSNIPIDAWIEIGPHPTTLPMLKSNGSLPRDSILLSSLRRQQDPWATLTTGLSQLYTAGVNIRWRATFAHVDSVRCISLPSYPFSPKKFWVDYQEPQPKADANASEVSPSAPMGTGYPMLESWKQRPSEENGFIAMFSTPIGSLARWISGHTVGGMPLCPASVYIEQALSGIRLACHHLGIALQDTHTIVRQLVFTKPLVYDESVGRVVVVSITIQERSGMFSISSLADSSQEETIHAHGEYRLQSTLQTVTKFTRTLPTISRYMAAVVRPSTGQPPEVFSTRTAYEVIFPRVVDYAKPYRTMRSITVDASSMEGCADVCLPSDHDRGKFVVHPVFMDTLLHVAGFVANLQGGPNDAFICSEVGSVKVIPHLVSNDATYAVYCSNAWVPEDGMVLADTYAVLCAEPRKIVAHMKGMQFRRVPLDRFKRGLSLAAGKGLIRPSKPQLSTSIKPQQSHRPASMSSTTTSASPSLHGTIVNLISQTCDLKSQEVDVNTDLASLGVDSLMSIEIFGKLGHAFPDANLNAHTLSFCTTVADIIREVSTKMNSRTSAESYSPTTTYSGTSTPRTLVTDDTLSDPTPLLVGGEPDVKRILASVLDVHIRDVEDDVEFENLGLDSLTSIEALHALKAECGLELPNNFFTTFHTPRAAQSYLTSQLLKPSGPVRSKTAASTDIISLLRLDTVPLPIQSSSPERLPLFLIHDGSGLVNYFERLSQMGRPVWGIHNPNFSTARAWDSVGQMAKSYADYISGATTGPVLLGGWSFGGVAAYEVAGHLERLGIRVQGILLIDSPSPVNHVPLSDALIDSILSLDGRGSSSELGRLVKAQFSMNSRLLGKYKHDYASGRCPPMVLLRSKEAFSPAGVDVPSWLSNRGDPSLIAAGWESLSGSHVKVIDIPGHHFQPFQPSNVQAVSLRMIEGCDYLERL